MVEIRAARPEDADAIWAILEPVVRAGTTYPIDRDSEREPLLAEWGRHYSYVATDESGDIIGTYAMQPNQGGGAAHVANCGYVTEESARGQGVAREMAEHSFAEALRHGFKAMQYNCVVSTNTGAMRLWHLLGFKIIGTIPRGFDHPEKGLVDAYIMYRWLAS